MDALEFGELVRETVERMDREDLENEFVNEWVPPPDVPESGLQATIQAFKEKFLPPDDDRGAETCNTAVGGADPS